MERFTTEFLKTNGCLKAAEKFMKKYVENCQL
jgi:hypothetical protein